jgi:hypothetical protein
MSSTPGHASPVAAGRRSSRRGRADWLTALLLRVVSTAGSAAASGGRWLAGSINDLAPRIPVRDADTLAAHHHGLRGEALADALVDSAVTATRRIGAAGGGLGAVKFVARRNPMTLPAQMALESVAIAAIEIKLVAELHEVYGVVVPGSGRERASAFAAAWADQRGVDLLDPRGSSARLGHLARSQLQRRLAGPISGRLTRTGPLLTGALAGGTVNARGTRELAERVRADLRGQTGR